MNKFISKIIGASLAIAMMIGTGAGLNLAKRATEVSAADAVYYTLSPTSGSNNSYAGSCDVNVEAISTDMSYNPISNTSITWNIAGNSQQNPWRIGGKNLSNVNRTVYSKTQMPSAIKKVDLTVGAASNITVNSLKLLVASNADFSTQIDEVTVAFTASTTLSFEPTNPLTEWAENAYYKFIFNVSVSGNSNRFLEFTKAEFYAEDNGGGQELPTVTGITKKTAPTKTAYWPGENFDPAGLVVTVAYSNDESVDVAYDEHKSDFEWTPETITTAGNVEIQYKDYSEMKVTQAVTLVTPLTVAQAISAIDAADNNTVPNAYVQGIISQIDSYNDTYHSITYWISDDGTTSNQFEVYSGKGLNGANFASIYDIELGATVVVYGTMKLYGQNPAVYEFVQNNCLKSYTEPVKTLVSISLEGNFKTSYLVSEALDTSNVKVIAKYDNGALKDVTSEAVFSDPAMATARRNTVTVSYTEGGVTATTSYRIVTNTQIQGQFNYYNSETIAEGDYLLVYSYDDNNLAVKNTFTSKRADAFDVTIGGQNRITTPYSHIVWHIAQVDGYYTFKSVENGKYLSSTGSKNEAQLLDEISDNSKWTLTIKDGKYDFENLARSLAGSNPGNKWLRYNEGYGFGCYSSSTGGPLELYRQNAYTRLVNSATKSSVSYRYTLNEGNYSFSNVAIRFTGSVGVDTWNDLKAEDEILGYGIMFAETSEVTKYGQGKTIKELYQPIRNYYSSVDECFVTSGGKQYLNGYVNKIKYFYTELADSESHPAQVGNEYGWNLYKNIDDSLEGASLTALTTSYTGVAFIRTRNSELIFLREENVTAGELAFRNLYNGTEFSNDEVRGSMAQMACLDIAA